MSCPALSGLNQSHSAAAAQEQTAPPKPPVAGRVTTKFKVSRQVLTIGLNQVSSVSLLNDFLDGLPTKGFIELTRRPVLTQAVSMLFAVTTENQVEVR